MTTLIEIPLYAPWLLVAIGSLGWLLCFRAWRKCAALGREIDTVSNAYRELTIGAQKREAELLEELNDTRSAARKAQEAANAATRETDSALRRAADFYDALRIREAVLIEERDHQAARAKAAEADADRLAPIVESYVRTIDETAALLKDDTPPALATERAALTAHASALSFRNHENLTQELRPDEEQAGAAR